MFQSVNRLHLLFGFFVFAFFLLSAQALAADIIIDDEDLGYSETGAIFSEFNHSCGFNGDYRFETSGTTEFAEWVPVLPGAGQYRVYVHYCVHSARPDAVVYRIVSDSGTTVVTVDQTKDANGNSVADFTASGWRFIGSYNMTPSSGHKVELDTSDPGDTVADAVRFSPDVLVPSDYEKIQDAIDAAAPTGRVLVDSGTYIEQLTISKSIDLIGSGAGTTIIKAPSIMSATNVRGGTQAIQAVVNAIGSTPHEISVDIRGFTIDGNYVVPWNFSIWFAGVVYSNADGTIQHNVITKIKETVLNSSSASFRGLGIWVGDASDVTIDDNQLSQWQRNGIEIRDSSATATITDNTLTGYTTPYTVVNGIVFYGSNGGTASGNTVTDGQYTGSGSGNDFYSGTQTVGIMAYDALGPILFSDNIARNNDMGIYSRLNSGGSVIADNLVENNLYFGIVFRKGDVFASSNTITGSEVGILVPSIRSDTGTPPSAHLNNIFGNTVYGVRNDASYITDARFNWWGSNTGPTHASNPGGTGDSVTNGVDFTFWLFKQFDPSDNIKPKVQQLILSDPSPVAAGTEMFTLIFDDDMNISFIPDVDLNKGLTSHQVNPDPNSFYVDGWSDIRTWHGVFVVDSSTGDGEYTVKISKARDINGNQMSVNSSNKILIDTVSPALFEVFAPDIFGSQDLTLSASAYDPGSSGISAINVSLDGGSDQTMIFSHSEEKKISGDRVDVDTYFLTLDGSSLSDGSHTALFSVFDGAGNEVDSSAINFNRDSTSKTISGSIAYLCKDDPESEVVRRFDFGTKRSPVQRGYTRATNDTLYPTGFGYGWTTVFGGSIDRGIGNKLVRDFVFNPSSREFKVNLPSDTYNVTVLMGDILFAHDDMSVDIEGTIFSNIDSGVGQIQVITAIVSVTDGQLNVIFSDGGGINADWISNGIEISSSPICLDGIEKQTINRLKSDGWTVDFDKYSDWTLTSLLSHDLIMCSDQEKACKPTTAVMSAHKNNNRPFVELADSSNAKAAASFGYLSSSGGARSRSTTNVFIERSDSITTGFFGSTQILSSPQRLTKITKTFPTNVKDIASADDSPRGTNLFKVLDSGSQGKYVYIGWLFGRRTSSGFTGWTADDLNSSGQLLLQRALSWAQCGNPTGCV